MVYRGNKTLRKYNENDKKKKVKEIKVFKNQ